MARGKKSIYTDTMGRFMTRSLFVETILKEQSDKGIKPMYSLTGVSGYTDVHQLYLESGDPTGYTFAIEAFDSWDHFMHLSSLQWFRKHLASWESELEIKMRSEGIKQLMKTATSEGSRGTTAAKYIADAGWKTKRGRPSKEDVDREQIQQARIKEDLGDDAKRMNLH